MNVRGPSLTNLGASCFINAGVQALLALPTLEASSETDAEKALKAVADMAQNSSSTFTPKPLTDRFYNRRESPTANRSTSSSGD